MNIEESSEFAAWREALIESKRAEFAAYHSANHGSRQDAVKDGGALGFAQGNLESCRIAVQRLHDAVRYGQ